MDYTSVIYRSSEIRDLRERIREEYREEMEKKLIRFYPCEHPECEAYGEWAFMWMPGDLKETFNWNPFISPDPYKKVHKFLIFAFTMNCEYCKHFKKPDMLRTNGTNSEIS